MRCVIQRVSSSQCVVEKKVTGEIGNGLLLLLGIEHTDSQEDIDWLVKKVSNMRIFGDEEGKMNLSVKDINGSFLVISQFTLFASTKKGNRPSYIRSARPEVAIPLYEQFINTLKHESGLVVETGIFGADMKISLLNDGPVTIIIDSNNKE